MDAAVTGTLLRAGTQVRVATQLVEAPERPGALVADDAGDRSTMSFSSRTISPATSSSRSRCRSPRASSDMLSHDAPATARSYEYYLRANELALGSEELGDRARSLPAGARRKIPAMRRRGRGSAVCTG